MALSVGQILNNRYRITAVLGQGGAGAVYQAWDVNLNTPVVVKENLDGSPQAIQQFSLEARQLAVLRHPNLPYVIDHYTLPGQGSYLVMEFVEGQDLQGMLRYSGRGLPEQQVLRWFEQLCDAVAYLHSQSPPVIHRDIKPANIKITPNVQAKLVDYGIARNIDSARRSTVVAGSMGQGFSAPELFSGLASPRSDIYSLGASLYAALTGQNPVDGVQRQMGQALPFPRQLNPAITPRTESAILQALEPDPSRRFGAVEEFKTALGLPMPNSSFNQGMVQLASFEAAQAGVQGFEEPGSLPPRASRNWALWGALAITAICLVGGIIAGTGFFVFYLSQNRFAPTQVGLDIPKTSTALAMAATNTALPAPTRTELTHPAILPPTATLTAIVVPAVTRAPTQEIDLTPISTIMPSQQPTADPRATWQPCANTYPSRLHVGDQAMVGYTPYLPNRVRSQPNTTSIVLGFLQPGEKMEILEGPTCANQWVWWRVHSLKTGLTGWTVEGDGTNYWLVPLK